MLKKRKEISLEFSKINLETKNLILIALTSLIMSLLICSGPIVLCINLYIFNEIKYFACFLVATFIGLIYLLFNIFYYNGIAKGQVKRLYYIYLPYNIIGFILVYICYISLAVGGVL